MTSKLLTAIALTALAAGCSSSPAKVDVVSDPAPAVVVILDDPGASALLMAHDCEKLVKKILKLIGPLLSPDILSKAEALSLEELICRTVAWMHLDRLSPETAEEVKAFFGRLPESIQEKLFETVGLDDFGVTPMEMDRRKTKTYAILVWKPGFKARVKSLPPLKTPERLSFQLEARR